MTDIREKLIQAVREWVVFATGLPEERVLVEQGDHLVADLPYITVDLTVEDIEVGTDEPIYDWDDDSKEMSVAVTADRRATASLNAYGRAGSTLLSRCHASLYQPETQRFIAERDVVIKNNGGTQNISELVAGDHEHRFVHDFDVGYRLRFDQDEPEPHTEHFEVDTDMVSPSSDD